MVIVVGISPAHRFGLLVGFLSLAACGPGVDEPLAPHEPRVCGQDGPAGLVSLDETPRWSVLRPVDGRWVLLSVFTPLGRALYEGERFSIVAHTLDPCGGDVVALPENLWPIVLGESLFGCDVRDGTVYTLDPHTGDTGAVVGTDLQCDPLRTDFRPLYGGLRAEDNDFVLMRAADTETIAVLDAAGTLTQTDISFTIPADAHFDGPYVVAPFTSAVGWSTIPERTRWSAEAGKLVLDDDGTLWQFTSSAADPRPVAEGVHEFLVSEDVVVIRRQQDANAESFGVQLLDLSTGTVHEGPAVTHLQIESGYLHLPDAFFDPVAGSTYPHPASVNTGPGVLPESDVGYGFSPHFRAWNVETGHLLIDANDGPMSGQSIRVWGDVVTVTSHQREPDTLEVWSYPLDGSTPELIYESASGSLAYLPSPDEVVVHPPDDPLDITYQRLSTGESRVLMPKVLSYLVHSAASIVESPVFDGQRPEFFWVEDGDRSTLTVTLLPET